MDHMEPDTGERGAWTPFVGVALAALTAGSLVVFSLVAQRTSLDGLSGPGVTAVAPSGDTPSSITLPGGGRLGVPGISEDGTATALLTPLPPAPVLVAATDDAEAELTIPPPAAVTGGTAGAAQDSSPSEGFEARFDDGGESATLFRDGEIEAASEDRHGEGHGKAAARGKSRGEGHGKATAKSKKGGKRGKGHAAPGRSRRGKGKTRGRSDAHGRSGGHGSSPSQQPSPAARSSRPSPAQQPQPASRSKQKGSSPGHAHSKSKGRSKGHGRGRG